MCVRNDEPGRALRCGVAAVGWHRVAVGDVPALRKTPGPAGGPTIAPALLKHADDQTVFGLAAVLRAIAGAGCTLDAFDGWGVLAAPRFLGRVFFASVLAKYRAKGLLAISPLIIPNYSLHSMSGTISLALKAHGTNFGVGGGAGHLAELAMAALGTLRQPGLPGLWCVATAWDPEPIPDTVGQVLTPAVGHALALALVPDGVDAPCGTLTLRPGEDTPASDFVPGVLEIVSRMESADKPGTAVRECLFLPGLGGIELSLRLPARVEAGATAV